MNITQATEAFLASLTTHTSRTYQTALTHLLTHLTEQGVGADSDVGELTVDHAITFVAWLRKRGPSKSTTLTYLTAVYRFYRYLLLTGADIQARDVERLSETYRNARTIRGESRPKPHELSAALAVVEVARTASQPGTLGGLRDLAIVETLRATGCRVGELVGLCLGDLDPERRSGLVKGKGSKWRTIYWDDTAWRALRVYLRERKVKLPETPLFVGHGNRSTGPLTTRSVSRIVVRLRKQVGETGVTPHYFRHVFATLALERTENLALVQDLLGHADPATTRVYAQTNETQKQEAHAKVWA